MRFRPEFPTLLQVFILTAAGAGAVACGSSTTDDAGSGTGGAPASGGTTSGGANSGGAATGGISSGGVPTGGVESATGGTGGLETGGSASGGTPGTGGAEGGSGGAMNTDCNSGTLTTRLPCLLSETGLYAADMTTLGDGVRPYTPQFKLWSDTASKRRWIWLPPDEKIDTTDMNFWSFPVGTKLWKEFSRDDVRVETRLIEKQKSGSWYTVAYLWREDLMEADAVPDGQENASGTEHDVPNADQCWTCHSQQPDKALGFSALQLAHPPEEPTNPDEWTLDRLVSENLLTTAPQAGEVEFSAAWSDDDRALFGYMHANCGTCHNERGSANTTTGLTLMLMLSDLAQAPEMSSVYQNLVDADVQKDASVSATKRIDPGDLDNSAAYQRFINKGEEWSMPPLATELIDPQGQQMLESFITGLP